MHVTLEGKMRPRVAGGAGGGAAGGGAAGGGAAAVAVAPVVQWCTKEKLVWILRLTACVIFASVARTHGFGFTGVLACLAMIMFVVVGAGFLEDDDEHMDIRAIWGVVLMLFFCGCAVHIKIGDCTGKHIPTAASVKNFFIDCVKFEKIYVEFFGTETDAYLEITEKSSLWPKCLTPTKDWIRCDAWPNIISDEALEQQVSCKYNEK
jgi:hypothetical protein